MAINLDALSGLIKTVSVAYKDESSAFGTGHKPEVYSELGDLVLKVLSVYANIGTFIPPPDALHKDDFSSLSYHVQNELALPQPHADIVVKRSIEVLISVANFATTEIQSTLGQAISQSPDEDAGADDEDEAANTTSQDDENTDGDAQSIVSQPGSDKTPEEQATAPAVPADPATDISAGATEASSEDGGVKSEEATETPETAEADTGAVEAPSDPEKTRSEPQLDQEAPAPEGVAPDSSPLPIPNADPGIAGEKPNSAQDGGVLTSFEDLPKGEETAAPEEQVDGDPKPTPNSAS